MDHSSTNKNLYYKASKRKYEDMRETYFEGRQTFLKTQKSITTHEKIINYTTSKLKSAAHQNTLLSKWVRIPQTGRQIFSQHVSDDCKRTLTTQ